MRTITLVMLIILMVQCVAPAPYKPDLKFDIDTKSNELGYVERGQTSQEWNPSFKDNEYEVDSTISPDENLFDISNRNDDQFSNIATPATKRKFMNMFQSVGKSVINTGLSNVASIANKIVKTTAYPKREMNKTLGSFPLDLQSEKTPSKSLFKSIAQNGLSTIGRGLSLGKTILEKGVPNVASAADNLVETAADSKGETNKTLASLPSDQQIEKTPSKSLFDSIAQKGLSTIGQGLSLGKTIVEKGISNVASIADNISKTVDGSDGETNKTLGSLPLDLQSEKTPSKALFESIAKKGLSTIGEGLSLGKTMVEKGISNVASIADNIVETAAGSEEETNTTLSSLPLDLQTDKTPSNSLFDSIAQNGISTIGKGLSLGKTIVEKGLSNVASIADNIVETAAGSEEKTNPTLSSLPLDLQTDKTPSKSLFNSIAQNSLSTVGKGLSLGKTIVEKGISNVTSVADNIVDDSKKFLVDLQSSKSLFKSIAQNGITSIFLKGIILGLENVSKMFEKCMKHSPMLSGIVKFIKSLLSNSTIQKIIIKVAAGVTALLLSSKYESLKW